MFSNFFIISSGEKTSSKKSSIESKNNNEEFSVIEYPHFIYLYLSLSHDDYIQQFLTDTKTCFHLNVPYPGLRRVTRNFTSDTTRINCAKLQAVYLDCKRIRQRVRDYFPNASTLQ